MPVQGKQILLIDPAQRFEVELMLRGLGMDVRSVATPAAALELASREDFDMALLDSSLVGDGAAGLVARLRAHTAIPSILVLTTESDKDKKNLARDAGATGWMVKPFDPERLIATIRKVSP